MGNLMGIWRYKEPSTVEECDSTWGSDSESERATDDGGGISETDAAGEDTSPQVTPEFAPRMKRSFYAARDLYKYRHSYPNDKPRPPSEYRNLRFYQNKIPLIPDGVYIEDILTKWRGDYDKLEHNHTYIQWLFPLREQGLNYYAYELTQEEIKEFQSAREAQRRFLAAYSLMMDFYGIQLLDRSGNVARAPNWRERFHHLNQSQHNYLRITRILKSLGELGYEAFKPALVRLFLEEALCCGTLPNMRHSALEYYVYTVRAPASRRRLLRFARRHFRPAHAFLWGPPPRGGVVAAGDDDDDVGAGSSGIRAPAPTPEPVRRGRRGGGEGEDEGEDTPPATAAAGHAHRPAAVALLLPRLEPPGGEKGCGGSSIYFPRMVGGEGSRVGEYREMAPL